MMDTVEWVPGFRRLAISIVAIATVMAACSPAVTTSPNASSSPLAESSARPSPTPSASPIPSPDVAGLFVVKLKALTTASMTVSATLQVGSVPVTIDGRYDHRGAEHYSSLTTTAGTTKQTTDETTWTGKTYTRTNGAPWYEKPATSGGGQGFASITASILSARDIGLVTKGGQSLHHLVPGGPAIDPKAIGFDGSGTVTTDFYAAADGTPTLIEFSIDVTQASSHVTGIMDFTFSNAVPSTITGPPDPIFTTFTSKKGYALGYPAGWDAKPQDGWDTFNGPNTEFLQVQTRARGTSSLATEAADDVYGLKADLKATIVSNKPAAMGGEPARVITYRYKDKGGVDVFGIDVWAIHGATSYVVDWESLAGNEPADTATLGFVADSFKFTR